MEAADRIAEDHNLAITVAFQLLQQGVMLVELLAVQELVLDILEIDVHILIDYLLELYQMFLGLPFAYAYLAFELFLQKLFEGLRVGCAR